MKKSTIPDSSSDMGKAMIKAVMSQMNIDDVGEAVRRIGSGEWIISEAKNRWTIDDEGIIYIYLPVTIGITGPGWVKTVNTSQWAEELLNSDDFWVTTGKVYKIAIIPGKFFSEEDRNTVNIQKEIDRRKWLHGDKISPETACLLRNYLSDQDIAELGLFGLVTMHKPIKDNDGNSRLLGTGRCDDDVLATYHCHPGNRWHDRDGLACVVSQDTQSFRS